jgi:signal transduction histidine kinase
MMEDQNKILQETQRQMAELNESLEKLVVDRTKSLDDTIHQLNKTIRELDAFVYSASHDIIAPLKSIQGLISLSRMHTKENSEAMTYLNYMDDSIKKLDEIIKNMIQFSRNSKLQVKQENINMLKEVKQSIEDFKFMKGFEEIDFQIHIDPKVEIVTDKQRLRIILSNLIGNAIKYYDPSKPVNEVSIKYENGNTTWKLYIHDNGIGIDKKYLSRVFEMFYRGTDKAYGSGLGLYIVKETVDRLKGDIFIDSEKGNWTKFELIFPLENPDI